MDGRYGVTKLGNTELVESGVQTYKCDWMIHICPGNRTAYVYFRENGVAIMKGYPHRPAYQSGIKTAMGHCVPPSAIFGLRKYTIPDSLIPAEWASDESDAGRQAFAIAQAMFGGDEETGLKEQHDGIDLGENIQVKADTPVYRTGNLYLQTHECNPFRKY